MHGIFRGTTARHFDSEVSFNDRGERYLVTRGYFTPFITQAAGFALMYAAEHQETPIVIARIDALMRMDTIETVLLAELDALERLVDLYGRHAGLIDERLRRPIAQVRGDLAYLLQHYSGRLSDSCLPVVRE